MSRKVPFKSGASAISDRSGERFPMNEMVKEPGTGYLVHRSESDGQWSEVTHPLNNIERYLKGRTNDPKPVKDARYEPTIPSGITTYNEKITWRIPFITNLTARKAPLLITFLGTSSLSITVSGAIPASATLQGTSSLDITATRERVGEATLSGTATATLNALRQQPGASTLSGTATVTLSADYFTKAVYTNDSPTIRIEPVSSFDGTKGTYFIDFTDSGFTTGDQGVIFTISDATGTNRVFVQKRITDGNRLRVVSQTDGETGEIHDSFLSSTANGSHKLALGYDKTAGELRVWFDGALLAKIEATWLQETFTQVDTGQLQGGSLPYTNGTLNQVRYFDYLLEDREGRRLTGDVEILASTTVDAGKELFVFMGSNNSVGQATGSPTYTNASNMYLLDNTMTIDSYSDPFADPTSSKIGALDDSTGNYKVGLAGFFADTLYGTSSEKIMVAPCNLSGTSFTGAVPSWDVSTSAYRTSGTKIIGLHSASFGSLEQLQMISQLGNIKGIIWNLGELDAFAGTSTAVYQAHLIELITEVRYVLGEDVPWFLSSVPHYTGWTTETNWTNIDTATRNVASLTAGVHFVEGTGITGDGAEPTQYTLAGYETVADLIAAEVQAQLYD